MSHKTLTPLMGNGQRLDGGAMFGNVPKALWQDWMPADKFNRVALCTRALLVEEPHRKILFEAGIGAYMSNKLKERYGVIEEEHILLNSLAAHGLSHKDIDIIVLSHLHFDHAGGLLSPWVADEKLELLFPRAQFVISEQAWQRALNPHARDKASFIPELMEHLQSERQRVHLVSHSSCDLLGEDYRFHYSDGHTPGLLITEIQDAARRVYFVSDLIPAAPWVHLPVTMGYDRAAEQLIDEKKALLEQVIKSDGELFFTHDPACVYAKVRCDEKGRYSAVVG